MSYLGWKLFHITAVILFLGNIVTGLFWSTMAHRSRDFRLIAFTFQGISRTDRWFTGPAVAGILVSGFVAAIQAQFPILGTGWIFWSIVLFSISGLVFGFRVAPLQQRITRFAREADENPESWNAYSKLYRSWKLWGFVAVVSPVLALVIMVLKLDLPGL